MQHHICGTTKYHRAHNTKLGKWQAGIPKKYADDVELIGFQW
jgi:hypothetical protein